MNDESNNSNKQQNLAKTTMTDEIIEQLKVELESLYSEHYQLFHCSEMLNYDNVITKLDYYWKYKAELGDPGYIKLLEWWIPWYKSKIYEGDIEQEESRRNFRNLYNNSQSSKTNTIDKAQSVQSQNTNIQPQQSLFS